MTSKIIDEIVKKHPPISEQLSSKEINVLLDWLYKCLINGQEGAIVEFGCYVGTASLQITRLLEQLGQKREFHVYDSFEGLPIKQKQDESPAGIYFVEGELRASKKDFINNFKKSGLGLPSIHKAWFRDLKTSDIPNKVLFAFLDGDYYSSIKDSLELIEKNLVKGSVIIVDDYMSETLPGAKTATDDWLDRNKRFKLKKVEQSLAIICDDMADY